MIRTHEVTASRGAAPRRVLLAAGLLVLAAAPAVAGPSSMIQA
ncbi:MAG: hypothetical protein OEL76_16585 [Siculibacillus sp.]|nr:hypothetical protein [Siculibacillus sp.]